MVSKERCNHALFDTIASLGCYFPDLKFSTFHTNGIQIYDAFGFKNIPFQQECYLVEHSNPNSLNKNLNSLTTKFFQEGYLCCKHYIFTSFTETTGAFLFVSSFTPIQYNYHCSLRCNKRIKL